MYTERGERSQLGSPSYAPPLFLQKLPKVNRSMAERLLEDSSKPGRGKKAGPTLTAPGEETAADKNPLGDQRFAALFTDPDFEVDEESEEFQRLHPVLSHRDKKQRVRQETVHTTASGDEQVGVWSVDVVGHEWVWHIGGAGRETQ